MAGNPVTTQRLHGLEAKLVSAGSSGHDTHAKALGLLDALVQQQSSFFAYVDNFRLLGYLALMCVPLALLFRGVKKGVRAGQEALGE